MAVIKVKKISTAIYIIQFCDKQHDNSFTPEFVDELLSILEVLKQDQSLKVLILAGLPSIFCSGADLKTLQQLAKQQRQPTDIILPKHLLDFPVPIIAAMEGHAVGGGFALGLCADIIILAQESRYGCSFMNMGFTPGMGITRLLEHVMSPAIAHELQYTGEFKKGKDFIGKTNINYILPKQDIMPLAIELATRIAEKPITSLKLLKRYLSLDRRKLFESSFTLESMMHDICFKDENILKNIEENYVR